METLIMQYFTLCQPINILATDLCASGSRFGTVQSIRHLARYADANIANHRANL